MFKAALDEIAPYRVPAPLHRIKLNQNENPCELPARLRARILARMKEAAWSRYPDFPAAGLRRRLARHTGRPEAEILIGHGSNELILSAALATLSRGSGVVLAEPGFALFERVATLCEAAIRRVRLNEDLSFPVDRLQSEAKTAMLVAVDGMVTNFHLPRSTLIMLVSAFAGREKILQAYETAKQEGYRFYSFGDAMLIL